MFFDQAFEFAKRLPRALPVIKKWPPHSQSKYCRFDSIGHFKPIIQTP
jgi:hypothetical protein